MREHGPQPLAVVAGALGELADEVHRERAAVDAVTASGPSVDPPPSAAARTRASASSTKVVSSRASAAASISSTGLARRWASRSLVVASALIDPTASSVRSWVSIEPDPFPVGAA